MLTSKEKNTLCMLLYGEVSKIESGTLVRYKDKCNRYNSKLNARCTKELLLYVIKLEALIRKLKE